MPKSLKQQLKGIKVREPRRIYHRPKKVVPGYVVPTVWEARNARCKVCYKVRPKDEMVEIAGGGAQGHRDYHICPEHK